MSELYSVQTEEIEAEYFDGEDTIENQDCGFLNSYAANFASILGLFYVIVIFVVIYAFILAILSFDCGSSCRPSWVLPFLDIFSKGSIGYLLFIVLAFLIIFFLLLPIKRKHTNKPQKIINLFFVNTLKVFKIIGITLFFLVSKIIILSFFIFVN